MIDRTQRRTTTALQRGVFTCLAGLAVLFPSIVESDRSRVLADDATKVEAMTDAELRQAVTELLQREQERDAKSREEAEAAEQRWKDSLGQDVERMLWSVEVIKLCVVCVSVLVGVLLAIGIVVGIAVHREVALIREKFRHPLESVGSLLGKRLERRFKHSDDE